MLCIIRSIHHSHLTGNADHIHKSAQHGLELDAVGMLLISAGVLHTEEGVVGGDLGGGVGIQALHESAREGGGVHVAGAVAVLGQAAVAVVGLHAGLGDHNAGLGGMEAHAREDDILGAQLVEGGQKLLDVGLVVGLAVLDTREEAGLGDVGEQVVGGGAETLHGLHVVHVKGGVELAVIRHGGVYDAQAVGGEGGVHDGGHVVDLAGRA